MKELILNLSDPKVINPDRMISCGTRYYSSSSWMFSKARISFFPAVLLFILVTVHQATSTSLKGKKAVFQPDARNEYGTLSPGTNIPSLGSFTLCIDMRFKQNTKKGMVAFTYNTNANSNPHHELGIMVKENKLTIWLFLKKLEVHKGLSLDNWHSLCLTWNGQTNEALVYVNKSMVFRETLKQNHRLGQNGSLVLGRKHKQKADRLEVDFKMAFVGDLYLFRLWDHAKGVQSISRLNCEDGNVITWDSQQWDFRGLNLESDASLPCCQQFLKSRFKHSAEHEHYSTRKSRRLLADITTESLNTTADSAVTSAAFTTSDPSLWSTSTSGNFSPTTTTSVSNVTDIPNLTTATSSPLSTTEGTFTTNPTSPTSLVTAVSSTTQDENSTVNSAENSTTVNVTSSPQDTTGNITTVNVTSSPQTTTGSISSNTAGSSPSNKTENSTTISMTSFPQNTTENTFTIIPTSPTSLVTGNITAVSVTSSPQATTGTISSNTAGPSPSSKTENSTAVNMTSSPQNTTENTFTMTPTSTTSLVTGNITTVNVTSSPQTTTGTFSSNTAGSSPSNKTENSTIVNVTSSPQTTTGTISSNTAGSSPPNKTENSTTVNMTSSPQNTTEYITTVNVTSPQYTTENSTTVNVTSSPQNTTEYSTTVNVTSPQYTTENSTTVNITSSPQNTKENAPETTTSQELNGTNVASLVSQLDTIFDMESIDVKQATTFINIINNLLNASPAAVAPFSARIIEILEQIGLTLNFTTDSVNITSSSLALAVSTVNATGFNGADFSISNITNLQVSLDEGSPQAGFAAIKLPPSLLNNLMPEDKDRASRMQFTFFEKPTLFQDSSIANTSVLNSFIVASSVADLSISNLTDPVRIMFKNIEPNQNNSDVQCVFWYFNKTTNISGWNSDGCSVVRNTTNETVCECNHLTHFGILLAISRDFVIDPINARILTFITYIGCGLSSIFLAITLVTYLAFEKLRRDYPAKILINLCTALLLLNMVFLIDAWISTYNIEGLCIAVAVFLHYFLLVSFTWMSLEAFHMYLALVKVFNTYVHRYMLKFCVIGWGTPIVVIAVVLITGPTNYGLGKYAKDTNNTLDEFCWINNDIAFYVGVVAYFCLMFLVNVSMFIVVMIQLCRIKKKKQHQSAQRSALRDMKSVGGFTVLLGITWGFSFFAWGPVNIPFMYLFAIFNTLQGVFIFIIFCAAKENVQKQWRRYLCCGKLRLAENSDWSRTATNNTKKQQPLVQAMSLSSGSNHSLQSNSSLFLVRDYSNHPNVNGVKL
uniref:adhesion G-protein coupled receptor G2-like isoform X3 n=1 Tax=Pristiophorus japonicus TaxID=55135 RepID=UPI00398E706C